MVGHKSLFHNIVDKVAIQKGDKVDRNIRLDPREGYVKSYSNDMIYAPIVGVLAYLGFSKNEAMMKLSSRKISTGGKTYYVPQQVWNHVNELDQEIIKLKKQIDELQQKTDAD